ncbi:MAG TPA: hypothetical protein VIU11_08660 [Nakamurella sp.]
MAGPGIGGLSGGTAATPPARLVALIAASLVMVLATILVVGYAGSVGIGGSAVSAERIVLSSGGVPIGVVGSFGEPAGPGDAVDPFQSSADGDRVVSAVFADLSEFWTAALSAAGRPGLVPPTGGFVSMDSSGSADAAGSTGSGALCITDPNQIAGNAFYCPNHDGIVFDSAALVPVLLGSYGSAGLAAAFAHEFGHAVQVRAGPTPAERLAEPDRYPAILIEAQADCAAGAFLAHAAGGGSTRVHIPAASLVRAVAPLLDFRDQPAMSPTDAAAHGLGLDRLGFVLRGFRDGGMSCWAMTTDDLALTLGRAGTQAGTPTAPRFDSAAAAVEAASASVAVFAGAPASAPDPADVDRSTAIGQFAAGAAVALATGRAQSGTDSGAACFTGAWTASVFGSAPVGELGSRAGDADEALDLIRSRPGVGFDELAAYSDGFRGGRSVCD